MTEQGVPDPIEETPDPEDTPGRRLEARIHQELARLKAKTRKRMTITWLAKEADVTRDTLYEWFSGERDPSGPLMGRVARALGIEVGELWAAWDGRPAMPTSFEDAAMRLIEEMRAEREQTKAVLDRLRALSNAAILAGIARALGEEATEPGDTPPPRRRRRTPPPPESGQ